MRGEVCGGGSTAVGSEAAPALLSLHRGGVPVLVGQAVMVAAGTTLAVPHCAPRAAAQAGMCPGAW